MSATVAKLDTLSLSPQIASIPLDQLEDASVVGNLQLAQAESLPVTTDPREAAFEFNLLGLKNILGFDIETYWSDFSLQDCCLLGLFKVFTDYCHYPLPSNLPKEKKREMLFLFTGVLQRIETENCVDMPEIVNFFTHMRQIFGLPPEFTSQINTICSLLDLLDQGLNITKPEIPDTSFKTKVKGLVYLSKIQEAAFEIILPEREFQKQTLEQYDRNLQRAERYLRSSPQYSQSERRLRENVRTNKDVPDDLKEMALKEVMRFQKDFSELPTEMMKAFRMLQRYQEISISELECSLDPSMSVYEKASALVEQIKKLEVFSIAANKKCKELLEIVIRRSLVFVPKLGPFAEEPEFKELHQEFLYEMGEGQLAFLLDIESYFASEFASDFLEKVDLLNLIAFLEFAASHLYFVEYDLSKEADVQKLDLWKRIIQSASEKKYHIPIELCNALIEVYLQSRETYTKMKKAFEEKYEFIRMQKRSNPSPEFETMKYYLVNGRKRHDHATNLDLIRLSLKQTVDRFLSHATSKEMMQSERGTSPEIELFRVFRRNIEAVLLVRREFAQSNYFCIDFFQPFSQGLVKLILHAHENLVRAQFSMWDSSITRRQKKKAAAITNPAAFTPPKEDKAQASSSKEKKESVDPKPEIVKDSPFDQFFLTLTGLSPSVVANDFALFSHKEMHILQRVYHQFLYMTSEELLQERIIAELEEGRKESHQNQVLVSECLHAIHMTTELALTQLYTHENKGQQIQAHNLFYLGNILFDQNPTIKGCLESIRLTNFTARYPHSSPEGIYKKVLCDQEIPSIDLLSTVQTLFQDVTGTVHTEVQKRLGLALPNLDVLRLAQSERKREKISHEISKDLLQAREQISAVLIELKNASSDNDEITVMLQDCEEHIKRINGSLQLLNDHATQRNYLLFVHQTTSAMQHAFELISYAYSCKIGFPLQTHNLGSYVSLLHLREEKILSEKDVEILHKFNTKKGIDYPLVSLTEHNAVCKYNHSLWEAFQISFNAFSYGEGFVDAKRHADLNKKYGILVEDVRAGVSVLKKLIQAFKTNK